MLLLVSIGASAQQITSVSGNVSDDMGPLMAAAVCEVDANGRIINSAITDMNGNFTMEVKSTKNKIRFTYVGCKSQTFALNKAVYNVLMISDTVIDEVVVKAKKRVDWPFLNVKSLLRHRVFPCRSLKDCQ